MQSEADALRDLLEREFLPGVQKRVLVAHTNRRGELAVVVALSLSDDVADEAMREQIIDRNLPRLGRSLSGLLARWYPDRPLTASSALLFLRGNRRRVHTYWLSDRRLGPRPRREAWAGGSQRVRPPGTTRPREPASLHVGLHADTAATVVEVREPTAPGGARGEAPPGSRSEGTSLTSTEGVRLEPYVPSWRRPSLPEQETAARLAHRLAEELSPLYPDPRIRARPGRSPAEVDLFCTVKTAGRSDDNAPFIRDYVRQLVSTLMAEEFAGVSLSGPSVVEVVDHTHPEADDKPPRDNPDIRNRPPREHVGLARRLEGAIARELDGRFNDVRVTVFLKGERDVEAFVRARTRGELGPENARVVEASIRQTLREVVADMAPRRRVSRLSRIRVSSYRQEARHARTVTYGGLKVSGRVRGLKGAIVEAPTAHVMRPNMGQLELSTRARSLGQGVFSGVTGGSVTTTAFRYREGLVPGFEWGVAYSTHGVTATPVRAGAFRTGSRGLAVLTGSLKGQCPLGWSAVELAGGVLFSLISDLDRASFSPDDYQELSSGYLVLSAPFAPGWRSHVFTRQTRVLASATTPASDQTSFGLALELWPFEELRVALEAVNDSLGRVPVGDFGTALALDGLHYNTSLTLGLHALGDLHLVARKIDRSDDRELGVSLLVRM